MEPNTQHSLAFLVALGLTTALAAQDGTSTFGHARTRQAAEVGRLPSPQEVAVADIVNYHRHRLPVPRAGEAVALDLRLGTGTVRAGGEVVVQVGMTTAPPGDRSDQPPLNLALVIDCSSSMAAAGKLDSARAGLQKLAERLRPNDRVALITYSSEAQVVIPSRHFGDGAWFAVAVAELRAHGNTNLDGGLQLGLKEVAKGLLPRGSNRVLLLTDGIANRGETDPEKILQRSRNYTSEGVDLTTIGVGKNLNTGLLDRLARGGNGLFHFVADGADLAKVFVKEVDMLLTPVARRAAVHLALPPSFHVEQVYGHEWRLGASGELVIPVPDMNAGLTSVIVIRCRYRGDGELEDQLRLRARLEALSALDGRQLVATAEAACRVDCAAASLLDDVVVRKNYTIAVVAQGLHDMARAAAEQRWVDADRALRPALCTARANFPNGDDPDVAAVVEMATKSAQVLQCHLDRFDDGE